MRIQVHGTLAHLNDSNSNITCNCLLYPIRNVNSNFKFPYLEFCNQINQNPVTGLMTDLAVFDCFLILFTREKSNRKKANAGKNVVKNFYNKKPLHSFKLMTVSN